MALPAVSEEDSVDILFHGTVYNLSVTVFDSAPEPMLALDLEDLATGSLWHAEYASSYIESITSKTGSFKRFSVLVKMLLTAMRQQTESVALDLLTYADLVSMVMDVVSMTALLLSLRHCLSALDCLDVSHSTLQEVLKQRKASAAGAAGKPDAAGGAGGGSGAGGPSRDKRYLILTYVVEFDRVHYPLPLQPLEVPSAATLQRQVRRLRREVAAFRALAGLQPTSAAALAPSGLPGASAALLVSSVAGMQREVGMLRERLAEASASERSLNESLREAQARMRAATEAASAGDGALEKLRQASRAEVRRLRAELAEAKDRADAAEANATHAQAQASAARAGGGGGFDGSMGPGGGGAAGAPGGARGQRESEALAVLRETNEVR